MGALEKLNISSPLARRHAEIGLLIHSAAAPHLLLLLKGAAKSATMEHLSLGEVHSRFRDGTR